MAFKLRFVQKFQAHKRKEFIKLEKKFIELEQTNPEFPKGRRYVPYAGREPGNTLIWESEFKTLEEAQKALELIESHPKHEELFQQQVPYFLDAYTEIYESIDE
jgi:hypothetical protein